MKRITLILIAAVLTADVYAQELKLFEQKGKYGFSDAQGKVVISPEYTEAIDFSDGLAAVRKGSKWGFIDKTGKEVIPRKYDDVWDFSEGLAAVQKGSKCGFIDKTGKEVIPPKYDGVYDFSEGLAVVRKDGKYGSIDKTGKEVIPIIYDEIYRCSEGLAVVTKDGKYGYIDPHGKELVPVRWYDYINREKPGIAKTGVWLDGKYGEIDGNGQEIAPLRYESREMQIIWEKLLIPNIKQINAYKSKPKISLFSKIIIEKPYLIVSIYKEKYYKVDIKGHPRNTDINEQFINSLKTLVVEYYYDDGHARYTNGSTVTSYGSYLVYFDIAKKECIGSERLIGPELPYRVSSSESLFNPYAFIVGTIESHLAGSK